MTTETIKAAWNDVAAGYLAYWAPRFHPWMEVAVAAMPEGLAGPIRVPCCGPGLELDLLASRFARSRLTGVDFSESMVELCRSRGHVAELGDAMTVKGSASVLSTFGLQQLPEPGAALRRWVDAVPTGGALSVMLWPYHTHDEGPFDLLRGWTESELGRTAPPWEGTLLDGLPSGLQVHDRSVRFPIRHASGEAFWRAFVASGPGRALTYRVPPAQLDELGGAMAQRWPGPFEHQPAARHLLVLA